MQLILLVFLIWSASASAESRFALVIGNSAYPAKQKGINDLGTLTNPKNDAEDVAKLLKEFGFILVDHQGENKPLIDGTKQQMDDAIDKFLDELGKEPDTIAWFYYSGHGVYLKDLKRPNESANYLLPIGQNFLASDPAKIKYNAVNAHLIKDRLQNMVAKDRLMILDACRDKLELSESKGFSGGEEFRPMDPEHGLMVVHATLHSYSSFENPKERNGNFTKQLLLALKQQSNQRISRAISVGIEKLKEANQQLDPKYRQHPRVEGILSQDFCLADCQTNLDPQIQAKQKELDELEKKLKEKKELALATPPVETPKIPDSKTQSKSINYDNWQELRTFTGHFDRVLSVAFSPDGKTALSGSCGNNAMSCEKGEPKLKQWNIATGKEIKTFKGYSDNVKSVAFSPDGHFALSVSWKTLKLWDIETGKEIRSFQEHSSFVNSVAFSPNGKTALSGSDDNTLKLWDIATGKQLKIFTGHSHYVDSVAFSPDGKTVLSGSYDETLKLWDIATGKPLKTFTGHSSYVFSVAFSPDGKTALSGSNDNTLKLWDIATGKEIKTFTGHSDYVTKSAFSPDGKTALSGSFDKTLKLWDITMGKEIKTFTGHSESVDSVAFSPDGRFILSGSTDHTLKLWGAP